MTAASIVFFVVIGLIVMAVGLVIVADRRHKARPEWVIDYNKVTDKYIVRRKVRKRPSAGFETYQSDFHVNVPYASLKQAQDAIDVVVSKEQARDGWNANNRVRYVYPTLEKL
jgi:hypothetical protein